MSVILCDNESFLEIMADLQKQYNMENTEENKED